MTLKSSCSHSIFHGFPSNETLRGLLLRIIPVSVRGCFSCLEQITVLPPLYTLSFYHHCPISRSSHFTDAHNFQSIPIRFPDDLGLFSTLTTCTHVPGPNLCHRFWHLESGSSGHGLAFGGFPGRHARNVSPALLAPVQSWCVVVCCFYSDLNSCGTGLLVPTSHLPPLGLGPATAEFQLPSLCFKPPGSCTDMTNRTQKAGVYFIYPLHCRLLLLVPSAVTNLRLMRNIDDSVTVFWDEPSSKGGLDLRYFFAINNDKGRFIASRNYTVYQKEDTQKYTFSVSLVFLCFYGN